ncbi:hypothetical protein STA3757_01920 [Stanieria sp. NIES-3757]|nr:hypothetical protein STA3757_01920 [Stanieria sp. NIES-3757]
MMNYRKESLEINVISVIAFGLSLIISAFTWL